MGQDTNIEWCDHSWSPWRGCAKVSAGCANCYAETLSKRNPAVLGQWGKGKPRVKAKNWNEPRKWNRQAELAYLAKAHSTPAGTPIAFTKPTVFPSLCDWLDEEVPIEWLAEFLQLIHSTPNLTWLLLTKRPENFEVQMGRVVRHEIPGSPVFLMASAWVAAGCVSHCFAPSNVRVGTSVEDQANADKRIPELLRIPAVGRFLSLEPLLGPVELESFMSHGRDITDEGYSRFDGMDWLIIGGESGPGARPCNVEWIRSLVRQGRDAGVPTFVKQLGGFAISPETHITRLPFTHSKGGDPDEWPEDLRVREFPTWGGAK